MSISPGITFRSANALTAAGHYDTSSSTRPQVLRLSVTDRCNFRCRYCMPLRGVDFVPHHQLLRWEEIFEQVRWLSRQIPIDRVRLTGGEPLVRPGLEHLISLLSGLPNIREVDMTTNGAMLVGLAWILKAAGLRRVNVSLDTLDPARFRELTQGGHLSMTLAGIDAALQAGLTPLKLNAVLRRSSWRQDVPMLLDYAMKLGVELRFIELMRTGTERTWCAKEFVTVREVQAWLGATNELRPLPDSANAPAARTCIRWNGQEMNLGWISPQSHPFCASCRRLRMDPQGRLRRCLMDPTVLDLPALQAAVADDAAAKRLREYLGCKHAPSRMDSDFAMSQLGG